MSLVRYTGAIVCLTLLSNCCEMITLKIVDQKGRPIAGAQPMPVPMSLLGPPKSNRKGLLHVCREWTHGVSAVGYESSSTKDGEGYRALNDWQTVVLPARN